MGRKLSYEEMDGIYAKNAMIVDSLERRLRVISKGLTEIIETCDAEGIKLAPKRLYELTRVILDNAIGGVTYIIPGDLGSYQRMLDDYCVYIDVIDEIVADKLPYAEDRIELCYNAGQYVKDYLYGIAMLLEKNPDATREELMEDIGSLSEGLREMLLLRAGCISEDFDDNRVRTPSPKMEERL